MKVALQWNRNTDQTDGYNVYRSASSGGPYNKINTALVLQPAVGTSPTYTDDVADGTYFYVVRAVNAAGESGNSNEVKAQAVTPPHAPQAPTGLTATVTTSVSLAVDGGTVANAAGTPPFALNYVMKKTTPPRDHQLTVRVA